MTRAPFGTKQTKTAVLAAVCLLLAVMGLFLASPAGAQSATDIADELDATGRYLDFSADPALDAAIADANSNGIAFAWLAQSGAGEAERLSETLLLDLDARGSRYRTVLVLMEDNFGAWSSAGETRTEDALDASFNSFADGAVADGVNEFTSVLRGTNTTGSATGTDAGSGDSGTGGNASGGGLSLGTLILPLLLLGGGFFLFRGWSNKRKADRQMEADLETDRAEIKEQLRSNADRVIDLGDRVVLTDNRELQDLYEKASVTYQDVSNRIDGATTVSEVDDLDDRIDEAEWQLKSIEAQLDGKPLPPSPAELEAEENERLRQKEEAAEAKKNDRPALGRDESVISGPRSAPRSRSGGYSGGYTRRRSSMGGGLGGLLGSIILGGMQGGGRRYPQTRRTQRRTGLPGGFPSGGGLGGGVLRRGGSSRSGGGRSIGGSRRGSGGGRSF